jgi:hypothetical protein
MLLLKAIACAFLKHDDRLLDVQDGTAIYYCERCERYKARPAIPLKATPPESR